MATITKKDKSTIITNKKGVITHHIPAKTTPTVGRVKAKKNTLFEGKPIAYNQEKYLNILINLGDEKDLREFTNSRLKSSYAFRDSGLSDTDFTLEELKKISVDGRTWIFKYGSNPKDLSDSYEFINLVANRLLKKTFSNTNPISGKTKTLHSGLTWTREINGYSEKIRYQGHQSMLLPEKQELINALANNEKVILKDIAHTFSSDTGSFKGNLILSLGEDNELLVDYSQFKCTCGAYVSKNSCNHSSSIEIVLKQRIIDVEYSQRWERCGG